MAKTVLLGASTNPSRYSFLAINKLLDYNHQVLAVGTRIGDVTDVPIIRSFPNDKDIDTVTLYLNPQRQAEYVPYILELKPRRVIFNPGTENPAFAKQLQQNGVEVVVGCTLVMLSSNQY